MEFKDVVGYEGLYRVREDGQVWSIKRGHFIAQRYDKDGYLRCNLSKDGKFKTKYIHRIVAEAFVPNPEGKPTVNHIDEDKENNHWTNLNWMTQAENTLYGTRTERAAATKCKPVRCVETGETYESLKAATAAVDCASGCICSAIKRNGICKGYHWEYAEVKENED